MVNHVESTGHAENVINENETSTDARARFTNAAGQCNTFRTESDRATAVKQKHAETFNGNTA